MAQLQTKEEAQVSKAISRTALGAASMRIFHERYGDRAIFSDAYSERLVSSEELHEVRSRRISLLNESDRELAKDLPGPEADAFINRALDFGGSMLLGFRISDDEVCSLAMSGGGQVVILGAGLDCTALRFGDDYPCLTFFEVDTPATQADKLRRIATANLSLPHNVIFTTADFERESLEGRLLEAGFQPDCPSFFCWLNVTCYLSWTGLMETLRAIRRLARGGGALLFDLYYPDDVETRKSLTRLSKITLESGEPIVGTFDPGEVLAALEEMGFGDLICSTGGAFEDLRQRLETDGYQFSPAIYLVRAAL